MSEDRRGESSPDQRRVLNYRGPPDRPPEMEPAPEERGGIGFAWGFGLALGAGGFAAISALTGDGQGVACLLIGASFAGLMIGIFDLMHARQGRFLLGFVAGAAVIVCIGMAVISSICGK